MVDADGRIIFVSSSISPLTSSTPEQVLGRNLGDLIHPDDMGVTMADLNESMATGNRFRVFFRLRKSDESRETVEAVGHAHIAAPRFAANPENQSAFCQAIIMMLRPYPSKADRLFDSFLETKIENERLKRWIAELHRDDSETESGESETEEGKEAEATQAARMRKQGVVSDSSASVSSIPPPNTQHSALTTRTTGNLGVEPPTRRDLQEKVKRRKINIQEELVCADCGKPTAEPRTPFSPPSPGGSCS